MTNSTTAHIALTDPLLPPFLETTFSPTDYLNTTLPSPTTTTINKTQPTLSTLASITQSHITAISALSARLTQTLTSLTDDILRSSTRLTYEIELLRGDALGLAETLSATGILAPAIQEFVPEGLLTTSEDDSPKPGKTETQDPRTNPTPNPPPDTDPITRLRTLQHVKSRLVAITQTFSLALAWPFPPSLLGSPLISVSDPTLEAQGQEACSRLRQEILDLMAAEGDSGGIDKAKARVRGLNEVVGVWKGTGEEKARRKWVEGLEKMVDDEERRRREGASGRRRGVSVAGRKGVEEQQQPRASGETTRGPGFLRNLQRLRDEIYME